MKVFWSNFAVQMLSEIYLYYKINIGLQVAKNIKNDILKATSQLKTYPYSGQIEPNLEGLQEMHRYLIKGNYKVIYKEIKEGILITDIFDTRQNPVKINDEKRNSK
jgi:plasmid stabilization system protein ParE